QIAKQPDPQKSPLPLDAQPKKEQADAARQLAQEQRTLKDAVQKAQSELNQPPKEQATAQELTKKQQDLAKEAQELAKQVARDEGDQSKLAEQAKKAADNE